MGKTTAEISMEIDVKTIRRGVCGGMRMQGGSQWLGMSSVAYLGSRKGEGQRGAKPSHPLVYHATMYRHKEKSEKKIKPGDHGLNPLQIDH